LARVGDGGQKREEGERERKARKRRKRERVFIPTRRLEAANENMMIRYDILLMNGMRRKKKMVVELLVPLFVSGARSSFSGR
jgi:hypothetical protein